MTYDMTADHDDIDANRSILPQDRAVSSRPNGPLLWVIAIMCFLASLTLGMNLAVDEAANQWSRGLTGSVTVQIKPTEAMAAPAQLERALAIIESTRGIEDARALTRADTEKLLEPWLGRSNILDDLPIPQLIEVKLDPNAPLRLEGLAQALAAEVPGATLDDHRRWNDRLLKVADAVRWVTLSVLALVTGATLTIIVFATRAGLSANNDIVEVLHLVGAHDAFVAKEFQRHFLWMGAKGGLIGAGAAVVVFVVLGRASSGDWSQAGADFLPSLAASPALYLQLLIVPLVAALASMATARITVMRSIAQMV